MQSEAAMLIKPVCFSGMNSGSTSEHHCHIVS